MRRRSLVAVLAAFVTIAACGDDGESARPTSTTAEASTTTTAAPTTTTAATPPTAASVPPTTTPEAPEGCPVVSAYSAPDPARPVIDVTAGIDVPGGVIDGSVTIAFAPDLPTDVIVLRLWPNGPRLSSTETVGTIVDTISSQPLAMYQPDDTTVEIAPGRTLAPGERIQMTVPFHLELDGSVRDRISHSGDTLRLGSWVPLLAWEPGVGWARDPATNNFAEATTSTTADWTLHLTVTPGYDVLATGRRDPGDPTTWSAPAVRDVGMSIGHFAMASATVDAPAPVEVTVGVDTSIGEDPAPYLDQVTSALTDYATRYGPYPWDTFSLAVTPDLRGGIEYPGHAMQGADSLGRTTAHEVAHQWFYGLVGDDQGRDPWLDEALASYAEYTHQGSLDTNRAMTIPDEAAGHGGEPMTYWDHREQMYYLGVYVQPAVALADLGPVALVDCALRYYVATEAHRIARPADLFAALTQVFPEAQARLEAVL